MIRLLLGSSIVGFFVGASSTALTHFLPNLIAYLAVIFVAVGMLGSMVYLMSVTARVNSTVGLVVAGFVAGAVGFYASWGTYLMFELNQFDLRAYSPTVLMSYALAMLEAAKDKGGTANLLLVWLFEAAMFLLVVPSVVRVNASKDTKTLCKTCKIWCEEETGFMRLQVTESWREVVGETPNIVAVCMDLPFATIDDDPHVRIDLSACESCMQRNSIRATLVTYQGANEMVEDWTTVCETTVRQLRDRKPEYESFIDV